jgi:hypothetical protein
MTDTSFMSAIPALTGSNTAFGQRYGERMRRLIVHAANNAPRSVQRSLGPSEMGAECDLQVVGKLVGAPATRHVSDPWASIVGTAIHLWMARALQGENDYLGFVRYLTELRVFPAPDHPGNTDAYDTIENICIDWKALGKTTLYKLKSKGPSRRYFVQLLLYALGCIYLGLPVKRVMLIALPRTESSLEGLYVWDHPFGSDEDIDLILEVLRITEVRKEIAALILEGKMRLEDVPITPDDSECYFCPFYRPQSAHDGSFGCPGTIGHRDLIPSRQNPPG